MASVHTLRRLHAASSSLSPSLLSPSSLIRANLSDGTGYGGSSGSPYNSGSTGRRMLDFQPSRLGPTTSLWATRDLMVARCRDEIRNNPWAASAADNFESQVAGSGIKPKWNLKDEKLKVKIEKEFHLSASTSCIDHAGLCNYYGLQALIAREIFEGGEVFIRRHIRPLSWKMRVPIQVQVIETEQLPVWMNNPGTTNTANGNIRVPSTNILHVYKPLRAGLLRGQPHLSSVLLLLHELSKYSDAAVVAKQIQTMFVGIIKKTNPDTGILPPTDLNVSTFDDPGTRLSHLEPGTFQELLEGEDITFPNLPQNSDLESFISVMLHQFASAIGATYEQITGDLRGVNLSSIRAGIQEAHRKVEQFIYNVMVVQFCDPFIRWWLDEAVLSGRLSLPGYAEEPEQYLDITHNTSGWPWLDPLKDVEAKQAAVRAGFTSRETVCAETGEDAAKIDAQQMRDNGRTDKLGLVYDSDCRKVLGKGESNPSVDEQGKPKAIPVKSAPPAPKPKPKSATRLLLSNR